MGVGWKSVSPVDWGPQPAGRLLLGGYVQLEDLHLDLHPPPQLSVPPTPPPPKSELGWHGTSLGPGTPTNLP